MNAQRISYPRLAGELVDSINALLSSGGFQAPGDGAAVCAIRTLPAPGAYASRLMLHADVGGSPVRVHLNAGAVEVALQGLIGRAPFAALDDDLKLAVLETALAEPLATLTELLGAQVVLQGIAAEHLEGDGSAGLPGNTEPCAPHSLLFEVCQPVEVVGCTVLVDVLAPLPASVLAKVAASAVAPARVFGGLPMPVVFELGTTSLSAAELRSLEPGDIVLFDQCHIVDGRVRVNICDSVTQVGMLDGFNLTIQNSS